MTGSPKSRSAAERVAVQLTSWPGLRAARPACGAGRGYSFGRTQILHLHTGEEADLRLERDVIERIQRALTESGHVIIRPGDDWVTVMLDTDTAGALLISLLSVAIQAAGDHRARSGEPCTWGRRSGLLSGLVRVPRP